MNYGHLVAVLIEAVKEQQAYLAARDAVPESWHLSSADAYPDRIIDLSKGRERALEAYENRDF